MQGSVVAEAGERHRYLGRFDVSGARNSSNFFTSGSLLDSDGIIRDVKVGGGSGGGATTYTTRTFKEDKTVNVYSAAFESEGRLDLVAAGQFKQNDRNEALIIAFAITKGNYKEIAREVFHIGTSDGKGKTFFNFSSLRST